MAKRLGKDMLTIIHESIEKHCYSQYYMPYFFTCPPNANVIQDIKGMYLLKFFPCISMYYIEIGIHTHV